MTDPTPTPQAPPQRLTDAQLRKVLWKCLCERKANESPFGAGSSLESDMQARIDDCRAAIAAHEAARPQPTPEEVEARFRAWWAESFPNAPAAPHAVRSHVAFALYLLGGEVA